MMHEFNLKGLITTAQWKILPLLSEDDSLHFMVTGIFPARVDNFYCKSEQTMIK